MLITYDYIYRLYRSNTKSNIYVTFYLRNQAILSILKQSLNFRNMY